MKESQWFSVDLMHASNTIRDMFEDYNRYIDGAKRQSHYSKTKFNFDNLKNEIDKLFIKFIPEFPKQIQLQLPKLKKLELPKLQK